MSLLGNWTLGYEHTHTHTGLLCTYVYRINYIATCRPASVLILIYDQTLLNPIWPTILTRKPKQPILLLF